MKKILIVEDDQLVATAYKKRFREEGYEVEHAPDGLEGIKMVTAVKPDIVLLDLLMPRLDGIEVLKYIRNHPDLKNLPVVVFSNSYMTNLVENAWRAGADQCLMKASTTPAQLFEAVNKAMLKAAARVSAPPAGAPGAPITPLARPTQGTTPVTPISAPAPARLAPPQPMTAPVSPLSPRPPAQSAPAPSGTSFAQKAAIEVDPEFQAQIRQLFLAGAPGKLTAVREASDAFLQDAGSSMQLPLLGDLFRKVHSLTGNAAVAGCTQIAHYASTFEALLQELQQKPKFINDSTARTISISVGFLEMLFERAAEPSPAAPLPASVLIVDANAMSAQAIGMAVEKAEFQPSISPDPALALATLASGNFTSLVVAVNLPGMSGFEFCAQMQSLPGYMQTPVVFVTSTGDFATHSNPEVLGNNDVIASPFLLIEMTLKAVTHVEWVRMQK